MKTFIYIMAVFTAVSCAVSSCSNQLSANADKDSLNLVSESEIAKPAEKEVIAKIHTDYGDIQIKLYNETPKHRDNFIKLANEGYYNGTLFHRVINSFMIQGGDPDSKNAAPKVMLGNGGPAYTIPAEFMAEKYFHKKGALAAAREGDQVNPTKASSGSQFYIVQGQVYTDSVLNLMENYFHRKFTAEQRKAYTTVGGTPHLDGAYTVYGEVVSGLEIIDKIATVKKDKNDRPLSDIKMTVEILK